MLTISVLTLSKTACALVPFVQLLVIQSDCCSAHGKSGKVQCFTPDTAIRHPLLGV